MTGSSFLAHWVKKCRLDFHRNNNRRIDIIVKAQVLSSKRNLWFYFAVQVIMDTKTY